MQAPLLLRHAEQVPASVVQTEQFFADAGVWYRIGRNSPATSCRDAAARRERLGTFGIPLWDELKSIAVTDGASLAFLHCRADREIDLAVAARALGWASVEVADDSAITSFGLGYGLVNPFGTSTLASGIANLCDDELLFSLGVPGTMMTNAGDLTWSVEFRPEDLVRLLPRRQTARISSSAAVRPCSVVQPKPIGILTGNSPESGMMLWGETINACRQYLGLANKGDVSMPTVLIESAPEMGLSMELALRYDRVQLVVENGIRSLCERGGRKLAIACNTTQIFTEPLDAIVSEYGAEFVSLPRSVDAWLVSQNAQSVGIVGIPVVADLGLLSGYARHIESVELQTLSERHRARVQELGYEIKRHGPSAKHLGKLRNIIRDGLDTEYVILALTELSTLLQFQSAKERRTTESTLLDPIKILADALARSYVGPTWMSLTGTD